MKALGVLRPFDWFAILNVGLATFTMAFPYRRRLAQAGAHDGVTEFALYLAMIVGLIVAAWLLLRRLPWKPLLLILVQLWILVHTAGILVHYHGLALYEVELVQLPPLDLRFDKIAHFSFGLVACLAIGALCRVHLLRVGALEGIAVVLVVLGLGAVAELGDYLAVRLLHADVTGGYKVDLFDNAMQDLIANLLGSLAFLLVPIPWRRRLEGEPTSSDSRGPATPAGNDLTAGDDEAD